jgi:hypothetical protein
MKVNFRFRMKEAKAARKLLLAWKNQVFGEANNTILSGARELDRSGELVLARTATDAGKNPQ